MPGSRYRELIGSLQYAALGLNPDSHTRSKHVDIQYHFARGRIQTGRIMVEFLPTEFMTADGLTKQLPSSPLAYRTGIERVVL